MDIKTNHAKYVVKFVYEEGRNPYLLLFYIKCSILYIKNNYHQLLQM